MEEELNITKQISIIPSMMVPKRMVVRRHPHQRIGRHRSQDSVEEKPTGIHRDDGKAFCFSSYMIIENALLLNSCGPKP